MLTERLDDASSYSHRLQHRCATFYRWYELDQTGGVGALEDKSPVPGHVWNCIFNDIREQIINLAIKELGLTPRELAVRFPAF